MGRVLFRGGFIESESALTEAFLEFFLFHWLFSDFSLASQTS